MGASGSIKDVHELLLRRVVSSASKTRMYSTKLQERPISCLSDLARFPITTYADFRKIIEEYGGVAVCSEPSVMMWQSTGTTDKPKVFYNSEGDCEIVGRSGAKAFELNGGEPGMVLLNAGAGLPWVSSTLVHLGAKYCGVRELAVRIFQEQDVISLLKEAEKEDRIDIVAGVPLAAVVLKYAIEAPQALASRIGGEIDLNSDKLRRFFGGTSLAFFGGESPKYFMAELKDVLPNAAFIDSYGMAEAGIVAFEIKGQMGMVPNLEFCILEISPSEEMIRWKEDPAYVPRTYFFDEWYAGLQGELIITPATACMPKLRLTPGDIVEVCDSEHEGIPKIKVLGRSCETINLEGQLERGPLARALFRSQIQDALLDIGCIKWWTADVYRDHVVLNVVPVEDVDGLSERVFDQLIVYNKSIREKDITVIVKRPSEYMLVQQEILRRRHQNLPLGQLKPKQICFIDEYYGRR